MLDGGNSPTTASVTSARRFRNLSIDQVVLRSNSALRRLGVLVDEVDGGRYGIHKGTVAQAHGGSGPWKVRP
jgi:hypothetical protein